jgi:ABC-2 type transport system permease protein
VRCVTFVAPVAPPAVSVDASRGRNWLSWFTSRIATFCIVEVQKLRHDRSELVSRAIQPALWLVIFGKTFSQLHAIPSGGVPYLDFLAPGVLAQSTLFVAVFYGIQVIWERDAGVLSKLMVTPTPRSALVTGKAFAAGMRAISQAIVVIVLSLLLGVSLLLAPWRLVGAAVVAMLGAAFFASLSMTVAGLVLTRERLMGIGQAITMPLFFASNALYPIAVMPGWLQVIARINPLSYEVNALRGLLIGTPTNLWLDFGALGLAVTIGVTAATLVLPRLVR